MRILVATPLYPPETGGPATYSKLLEDELPKRGIEVAIAKWRDVALRLKLLRHVAYFRHVLRLGRSADVILALDPVSVGLPALCAARLLRKRFLVKVVGDFAWEQWMQRAVTGNRLQVAGRFISVEEFQTRRFGPMTELRRLVERFVARRAERVIVPSQFLKRIVMAWGAPESCITVVYNAFDPPRVALTKTEARGILGLGGTVILSAGRLVPWKGFAELIARMPEILGKFPDARLYIAGDGPEAEGLKLQIVSNKLEDHVILLGRLDHEALYRYIIAADVFVLYTGYEGLSHQLLEVMALGTPVVTTNAGGNPELVEDGQSGRLVDYGDGEGLTKALLDLLSHPPAGGRYAAAAEKKAHMFSVERMIEETARILDPRP